MNELIKEVIEHAEKMNYPMRKSSRRIVLLDEVKEFKEVLVEPFKFNSKAFREEMADVFITSVLDCVANDVDFAEVVREKIKFNEERGRVYK